MLEAIALCENITGKELRAEYVEENRRGDHIWWISDLARFQEHYPGWKLKHDVPQILQEIFELNLDRWSDKCLTLASETYSAS
jgi:CDP-paratose 2-epimerase